MTKTTKPTVAFKPYHQHQEVLFPPSLEDLIPKDHVVRMTDKIIDAIDLSEIIDNYKGGGASSYHPRMLLKVIIYAYTQKIYSGRQIAKSLRENIHFMWLSGKSQPDFRTLNQFRSERLGLYLEEIFIQVVGLLRKSGFIRLEHLFVDGTKIKANANQYSYVWKKSNDRYRNQLREKVRELFKEIDTLNASEDSEYGDKDYAEMGEDAFIDPEVLKEVVANINKKMSQKSDQSKLKHAKGKLEREYIPKAKKYRENDKKFSGRNSFSKTDPDATFMRMKEDSMRKGQLKPGYNVQIATEDQFILGYGIYPNPTDTKTLIPFLEQWLPQFPQYPKGVVADAGYGSEENYRYLTRGKLAPYVKYNHFDNEQKRRSKKNRYRPENWEYNSELDEYICPEGRRLVLQETETKEGKTWSKSNLHLYRCKSCKGCAHRTECNNERGNKQIQFSPTVRAFRQQAKAYLMSDKGKALRLQRSVDVESTFGQIKHNREFRSFRLRGKNKVKTEWGLISLAHNISKMNRQKSN